MRDAIFGRSVVGNATSDAIPMSMENAPVAKSVALSFRIGTRSSPGLPVARSNTGGGRY